MPIAICISIILAAIFEVQVWCETLRIKENNLPMYQSVSILSIWLYLVYQDLFTIPFCRSQASASVLVRSSSLILIMDVYGKEHHRHKWLWMIICLYGWLIINVGGQ